MSTTRASLGKPLWQPRAVQRLASRPSPPGACGFSLGYRSASQAERNCITASSCDCKQQFEREPGLGAKRMVRTELLNLCVGPSRVAFDPSGLHLDAFGGIGRDQA